MADDRTRIQEFNLPNPGTNIGIAARLVIAPVQREDQDEPLSFTELGTPYYTSIVFNALSAKDSENLPPDVQQAVQTDFEINDVLVTIAQSKNIVKTALNGRNGTVKEYIASGDYSVTVEGRLTSKERLVRPVRDMKRLKVFIELGQSLEISSKMLNDFGITDVVVNDYSFHEVEGYYNTIAFRLLMWSDTEFKIEPTQETNASQGGFLDDFA